MRLPTLISSVLGTAYLVAALPAANIEARGTCGSFAPAGFCPASPTSTGPSSGPSSTPGSCTNPTIRKEWRTFSVDEKKAFLSAVKCLGSKPHNWDLVQSNTGPDIPNMMTDPSISMYDDMVFTHIDLNHHIHSTGWFFPWHRWYLNVYARLLTTQCGYTGALPYWDWTQDAADFEHATFWDADPNSGVGTWGNPNNDYQIEDGAWGLNSGFKLHYPSTHAIRRQFTPQPYLQFPRPYLLADVNLLANETFTKDRLDASLFGFDGDFQGFQKSFQDYQGPHAGVHLMVGADLTGLCPGNAPASCVPGESWSPNDPLFFMHHAMVDKTWYDWQNRASNKYLFQGGSTQMLDSLASYDAYPLGSAPWLSSTSILPTGGWARFDTKSSVAIQDLFDTQNGYLCYTYQ
ncbi:Di-copper centre-containing protein [Pluteus cervinus]|uniref:Di-copper centre-containing protein n=1 Tax=Pluteus cervinus TaxID=181527 RepID=A0ACD3AWL0_9AGAR|nr:Di-copper centre-containing protein [Pluteus cervinus]